MSRARPIGVGVIGFGFMGRTHVAAYRSANEAGFANRVVAVCAPELAAGNAASRGGNLGPGAAAVKLDADVRVHSDVGPLLADPAVELVSICTPTDTHVALALRALAAGKHVLVEKPVALAASDVARLADAARGASTLCMPAMCMRFWPGWSWLQERIRAGTFGAVRSAVFARLGSRPDWNREFYADFERSGGALFDLHVHDADFVRWCFGDPERVASAGSLEHVTTLYRFARGPEHVVAEGGWGHSPGFGFRMRYTVVFDDATAEFELGRAPAVTLARDGRVEPVSVGDGTGYDGEVRHLLGAIASGSRELGATLDEAIGLARLLEAERASLAASP